MVNKVILEGVMEKSPYMTTTDKGTKKALFTLKIQTHEEGATRKYIPCECYGKTAEKIELLTNATLYCEGKLYTYKSTKFDKEMVAVTINSIDVDTSNVVRGYDQLSHKEEAQSISIDPNFCISEDDLPF